MNTHLKIDLFNCNNNCINLQCRKVFCITTIETRKIRDSDSFRLFYYCSGHLQFNCRLLQNGSVVW